MWGPSPRNLVSMAKGLLTDDKMQGILSTQLNNISKHGIYGLIFPEEMNSDEFASSIIFVRPSDPLSSGYHHRGFCVPWIPTKRIATAIAAMLRGQDAATQAAFFRQMSEHALSRSTAGWIFETWVHTRLLMAGPVPCFWHSTPPGDGFLPTLLPENLIQGTVDVLRGRPLDQPFYWKPSASNLPGIDSVLYDGNSIFAIQSAISATHRSAETGLDQISTCLPAAFREREWHLVHVTPHVSTAHELMRGALSLPSTWSKVPIGACTISLTSAHSLVSDCFLRLLVAILLMFDVIGLLRARVYGYQL